MGHEARLIELSLELPPPAKSIGVYRPVIVVDGLVYLSGHGPVRPDGTVTCGRLGEDLDVAAGYEASRRTAMATLATLRGHFGGLDAVRRILKTTAFVNAAPQFKEHPAVVNGFSELIRDVFGTEGGIGARSAVGVASLPGGWAVEIETIFELESK
jgi:enamine deaminase RidA (YjgF/YER057c/UK114 family)